MSVVKSLYQRYLRKHKSSTESWKISFLCMMARITLNQQCNGLDYSNHSSIFVGIWAFDKASPLGYSRDYQQTVGLVSGMAKDFVERLLTRPCLPFLIILLLIVTLNLQKFQILMDLKTVFRYLFRFYFIYKCNNGGRVVQKVTLPPHSSRGPWKTCWQVNCLC